MSRVAPMRLAALAVPVIAASAVVAACRNGSQDSALTEDEYFRRFEAIVERLRSRQAAMPTAESADEATIRRHIDEYNELFLDFVEELDALRPPPSLADAHTESVAANRRLFELVDARIEGGQATAAPGLTAEEYEAEVDAASARTGASCRTLQEFADARGIEVDLCVSD